MRLLQNSIFNIYHTILALSMVFCKITLHRKFLRRNKQGISKNPLKSADFRGFLVRVTRFERAISTSQMWRGTNSATPGYSVFCYYTTLGAKIKVFPVCGQSCGQSRFSASFHSLPKSRKRPCFKAFRAFTSQVMDGVHRTPKCGAVPAPLHPDIQFLLLYHAGGENQRFSCLWSFLWSRPLFGPVWSSDKIPQTTVFQNLVAFGVSGRGCRGSHSQS